MCGEEEGVGEGEGNGEERGGCGQEEVVRG